MFVMFLLSADIFYHCFYMIIAHAERTVSFLPTKRMGHHGIFGINPFGRGGLHYSYYF